VVTNDIDLNSLSLEEQEARAKLHTHEHGFMTGKGMYTAPMNHRPDADRPSFTGGAGNYHMKAPVEENGRGRDSNRSNGGGLIQNIFRSLSRSTGKRE
jgi:hypothetical protein